MSRNSGNGAGLEYGEMGDRLREARQVARPQPARPRRAAGGLAEPHLPGRDRAGQAVGQHPLRDRHRAWDLARRAGLSRRSTAVKGARAGGVRGAQWRDDARRPGPTGDGSQVHPARVGRDLGAADDGVSSERRLPVRDLRSRWSFESRARVPAPRRRRNGATSSAASWASTSAFDEYVLGPGDAVAFDSGRPHRLFNTGDEPVHAIWFVLGRRPADPVLGRPGAVPRKPPASSRRIDPCVLTLHTRSPRASSHGGRRGALRRTRGLGPGRHSEPLLRHRARPRPRGRRRPRPGRRPYRDRDRLAARPAAGSVATSIRSRSRCTSSAASCCSRSTAPSIASTRATSRWSRSVCSTRWRTDATSRSAGCR